MTVKYLICATDPRGIADAIALGYTAIAINRFATPEKNDIRVVRRFHDLIPLAGVTQMIRGSDFKMNPEAGEFERFVESGRGRWIGEPELPDAA